MTSSTPRSASDSSLIGPHGVVARGPPEGAAHAQRAPRAEPAVVRRPVALIPRGASRQSRCPRPISPRALSSTLRSQRPSAVPCSDVPTEETAAQRRPALVAQGVQKRFKIPEERSHTLKERALHPLRRSRHEELQALKDISFAVEPGEFFGIVGRNGSGKSTLLKCLAGIYRADEGKIWCNGRMSTFIELGVGFNPDLAAFDNVALNGIMLGLSPREARARYERVIEFAELEEFQDLKLKNYSSGMHVRLAFSVAIQVDADILLIDEVLAVGDASFQQKCFDVFNRMREEGRTIIFVTHDMGCGHAHLPSRDAARARRDREHRRSARSRRPLPGDRLRSRGRPTGRPRTALAWATVRRA